MISRFFSYCAIALFTLAMGAATTASAKGFTGSHASPSAKAHVKAVKVLDFEGKFNDNIISLSWSYEGKLKKSHFELECSTDGHNFMTVKGAAQDIKVSAPRHYRFTGIDAANPDVYYRLVLVDASGQRTNAASMYLARKSTYDAPAKTLTSASGRRTAKSSRK